MKYSFFINKGGYPEFSIEKKYWQLSELGSFKLNDIIDIVYDIEDVIKDRYEKYDFGYEVYMIKCDKNNSLIVNNFENDKIEAIIPTQEVYELMRDWRDYLMEWNKKEAIPK